MLGFVNKLFISVQLIFFLDHVLLLAELAQKFKFFKIVVWKSDSMKRNFGRFIFKSNNIGVCRREIVNIYIFNSKQTWSMYYIQLLYFDILGQKGIIGSILAQWILFALPCLNHTLYRNGPAPSVDTTILKISLTSLMNTDYGHTMTKFLILSSPNSTPTPK